MSKTGAQNDSIVSGKFSFFHASNVQSGLHLTLKGRKSLPQNKHALFPGGFIHTTEYFISHYWHFSSHDCAPNSLFSHHPPVNAYANLTFCAPATFTTKQTCAVPRKLVILCSCSRQNAVLALCGLFTHHAILLFK